MHFVRTEVRRPLFGNAMTAQSTKRVTSRQEVIGSIQALAACSQLFGLVLVYNYRLRQKSWYLPLYDSP